MVPPVKVTFRFFRFTQGPLHDAFVQAVALRNLESQEQNHQRVLSITHALGLPAMDRAVFTAGLFPCGIAIHAVIDMPVVFMSVPWLAKEDRNHPQVQVHSPAYWRIVDSFDATELTQFEAETQFKLFDQLLPTGPSH